MYGEYGCFVTFICYDMFILGIDLFERSTVTLLLNKVYSYNGDGDERVQGYSKNNSNYLQKYCL